MNKIEIDRDLLYKYYIEENKSLEEISIIMNASKRTIQRKATQYGFKKSTEMIKENREKTMLQKYGVNNIFKDEATKAKIKEKSRNTLLERYGVEHNLQIKALQEKIQRKKKEQFYKDKTALSSIDNMLIWVNRFNIEHGRKPNYSDLAYYMNIAYTTAAKYINKFKLKDEFDTTSSRLESIVEDFIKTLNIEYIKHDRKLIHPKELDFYLPEYNIAIEVNDTYSHNSTNTSYGADNITPKNYHQNKVLECANRGIHLIHLYEWEILDPIQFNKIKNYILNLLRKSRA